MKKSLKKTLISDVYFGISFFIVSLIFGFFGESTSSIVVILLQSIVFFLFVAGIDIFKGQILEYLVKKVRSVFQLPEHQFVKDWLYFAKNASLIILAIQVFTISTLFDQSHGGLYRVAVVFGIPLLVGVGVMILERFSPLILFFLVITGICGLVFGFVPRPSIWTLGIIPCFIGSIGFFLVLSPLLIVLTGATMALVRKIKVKTNTEAVEEASS